MDKTTMQPSKIPEIEIGRTEAIAILKSFYGAIEHEYGFWKDRDDEFENYCITRAAAVRMAIEQLELE